MKRAMNVETIAFSPSDWVPNNRWLPVLIYRGLLAPGDSSSDFESLFSKNGWTGVWKNGVFDYQHYHSGAHEALGVCQGSAILLIGGPQGEVLKVSSGDCLVLPAGTGHQNLGSSSDFEIVGAYPHGQHADIQTAAANDDMLAKITSLPVPASDPVHGASGGLVNIWHRSPGVSDQ